MQKNKNWHLNDCTIYITVEPCLMCVGAINQSQIKETIFCVENNKYGASKSLIKQQKQINSSYNDQIKKLLKDFFKEKRK